MRNPLLRYIRAQALDIALTSFALLAAPVVLPVFAVVSDYQEWKARHA